MSNIISNIVPEYELNVRMQRFKKQMEALDSEWKSVLIVDKVNQYYFTGTMQDGVLLIFRDKESTYWVRKSYDRAIKESNFVNIEEMRSYRDIAAKYGDSIEGVVYLETELMPLAMQKRIFKYLAFNGFKSVDFQLSLLRSVKSEYELAFMEQSGEIHRKVLEDVIPNILEENMTELDLVREIYSNLMKEGHHGITRMGAFGSEMVIGQIGFGDSSIYPTNFNGPGGAIGMSPAVPGIGSNRKLKKEDLVFVDVCCGVNGYNTDKTSTYVFKGELPESAIAIHEKCVNIQDEMASKLKVGNIPSVIYQEIMDSLDDEFKQNFMGYGKGQVKFLGHGIGLVVDEYPVIARGFDLPLEKNMTMALEPKKGIKGIGSVGIENTFVIGEDGGRSITGTNTGLIQVN